MRIVVASVAALVIGFFPSTSRAACGSNPNVVYLAGSSAAKPFIAALARALYKDTDPLTIVYQSSGSCAGVDEVLNGTQISGTASYWDPASAKTDNEETCTIGNVVPDAGLPSVNVDVGISDVFASSCLPLPNGLPPDVGDFFGPIQPIVFVTNKASAEKSISATAAYFIYGFGAASGVAPWTDPSVMFRRNTSSGTQALISAAIGLPVGDFKGVDAGSAAGVVSSVSSSSKPAATIGFAATTDVLDPLAITTLAYKHFGQSCAWYPDSTLTSHDKLNVREGRYALWGPIHFLSKTDSNGYPKNQFSKRVVNYLTGTTLPPGNLDLLQVEQSRNLIPRCAMKTTRTSEMGAFKPYVPQNACNCRFDELAQGKAGAECQKCTKNQDCPSTAATCSYGYCEAQ
jgi:PBP superfamily domain